jgi:hypothetical protein
MKAAVIDTVPGAAVTARRLRLAGGVTRCDYGPSGDTPPVLGLVQSLIYQLSQRAARRYVREW